MHVCGDTDTGTTPTVDVLTSKQALLLTTFVMQFTGLHSYPGHLCKQLALVQVNVPLKRVQRSAAETQNISGRIHYHMSTLKHASRLDTFAVSMQNGGCFWSGGYWGYRPLQMQRKA